VTDHADSAARGHQVAGELSRDLKLYHVIMMGLAMMIGAGVFVGISLSVKGAGPGGLLLTFALNGLIALFTAMSFAELSSAIPRAGGAYNFARIGFGRGASFLAGWMEWFAGSLAGAFYAIVFAEFTMDFLNQVLGLGLEPAALKMAVRGLALLVVGLFIYINFRGSGETGKIGAIFTVGQMVFVASIGVVGIIVACVQPSRLVNFRPFLHEDGWLTLLGTMGVIYVAFEGFEVIAQAGDETIDPKRNLPKAMLYSVVIVTITYLAVAFASVVAIKSPGEGGLISWFQGRSEIQGFREAVVHLMPGVGGPLVTLAVIFSSTSALNATIYSATRASYALGRDGMLPPVLARIHRRRKTPFVALAMTSVIVLTAVCFLDPKSGAAAASMMFLCLFFLVNLCVIRIRRSMGDELEYGFIMPLFPLFPLLAMVCQIALAAGIFGESLPAFVLAAIWVPAGAAVYFFYARTRAPAAEHEIQVIEEAPAAARSQYNIMVAVANPANAIEMVRTTYRLSGAKDAQVELLHMVPVPPQVSLTDASRYMLQGRESMVETMLYLAPMFPISTTMRYCRNISRGIVSAVREKRTDMLILGWHGRRRGGLFKLGSTIDPVIERCSSKVIILKDCGGNRQFGRVLVPVAGGPNSALAAEVASILAEDDTGEVTLLTVATPDRQPLDLETFTRQHAERLHVPPERIRRRVVEAQDVARAILTEADEHDLVVLGCSREPILRRLTRATLPDIVARRCPRPLVMVNDPGGLRGWIRRWI